jgi:hypothetical protein
MTWLYLSALAVLTVLGVVKLVQWNRRRLISDAWLAGQDQLEWKRGCDGVCWDWEAFRKRRM